MTSEARGSEGHFSLEEIGRRLRVMEDNYLLMQAGLTAHLIACEKRGARLEKLAWASGTTIVAILGLLLKAYFHFGP